MQHIFPVFDAIEKSDLLQRTTSEYKNFNKLKSIYRIAVGKLMTIGQVELKIGSNRKHMPVTDLTKLMRRCLDRDDLSGIEFFCFRKFCSFTKNYRNKDVYVLPMKQLILLQKIANKTFEYHRNNKRKETFRIIVRQKEKKNRSEVKNLIKWEIDNRFWKNKRNVPV